YDDCIREWKALTNGNGSIHFQRKSIKGGAEYLAKYSTKGVKGLNAEIGAKWYASGWDRRRISTSGSFFERDSKLTSCCKSKWIVAIVAPHAYSAESYTAPHGQNGREGCSSGGAGNRGSPCDGIGHGDVERDRPKCLFEAHFAAHVERVGSDDFGSRLTAICRA